MRFSGSIAVVVTVLFSYFAEFSVPVSSYAADTQTQQDQQVNQNNAPQNSERVGNLYIQEYRVEGTHQLPRLEVEEAVYPFLGPGRTTDDVENARAALEKAYQAKGYQTVGVQIPPQQVTGGIVVLQVVEGKVGRLRIHGSRYFSLDQIRRAAPSLAEGKVPNFNDVTRDIVALNQSPDRRVTPTLRAGVEPGTVDVDLNVKDSLPLHGTVELNNRYSPNTTSLRLNGSISYNNLWQLGHSIGFSFQLAPENIRNAEVFSAYYLFRFPNIDWLSFILQGTKQDSNVSTLGSIDVAGRGEVLGARAIFTLPALGSEYFHSISLGMDYKHFDQLINIGTSSIETPITYYPITVAYSGSWIGKSFDTEVNASVNFHFRGLGSSSAEFDNSRFKADGDYIYFRGDLSHTQDLPFGLQLFVRVLGQIADQPLINSEQIAGGGLGTVRGYLEAETLGDNGIFGSLEFRSPSILTWLRQKGDEWRFYAFLEGGSLTLRNPLPQQTARFDLASYGVGTHIKFQDHFNGSIDLGIPVIGQSNTTAHDLLLTFRMWADF
jgi:hemolysin activation/secretion protein